MVLPRLHTELQGGCKCYVSSPVAKTLVLDWKSWLAQLFLDVFLGPTLTGPKKASISTILYNRLNKEKTPGRCCQSGYLLPWWLWCTIGGLGTLRKCYVNSPVARTLVLDSKYIQTENTTHTHTKKKNAVLLEWSWNILNVFDILLGHMVQLGQRVVHVETTQAVASIKWGPR